MEIDAGLNQGADRAGRKPVSDLPAMVILASAVAGLLYFAFFQLAPWIWTHNQPFKPDEVAVWQLLWLQDRDGLELYALYILMFLDLLLLAGAAWVWQRWFAGSGYLPLLIPVLLSIAFFYAVGFHPPMSSVSTLPVPDILLHALAVLLGVLPVLALLHYARRRSHYLALTLAALLLVPVCFVATEPIEWYDYSFILAPALRLIQGAGLSDVYLPYDALLSLLGAAWMKLQLDLNAFQVLGRLSCYLMLLAVFACSIRWFLDKRLAVFLLVSLVLMRIYAGPFDVAHGFQLTPMRIDLWMILLALVYFKGAYHWSMGLSCAILLLLHKNFGIIYTAAYVQLLLTLSLFETRRMSGNLARYALTALGKLVRNSRINILLILSGLFVHYLFFMGAGVPGGFSFESLGISFTRISAQSFYWYVVIVSGLAFMLLVQMRARIPANYFSAGVFLVYLSIGNSLYFFGHSHENAMIVLSAVLLLMFFMMLDLAGRYLADAPASPAMPYLRRHFSIIVSLVFVISLAIWYGPDITRKAAIQASSLAKGQLIYPSSVPQRYIQNTLASIRTATGNSRKVYFVGDYDFLFDYYGGYAPVGYYNPVYSWISTVEFNKFLQGLLDSGYYVVVDEGLVDVLTRVRFAGSKHIGQRWVVWR